MESTISGPKERYTFGNEPFYVCMDFLNWIYFPYDAHALSPQVVNGWYYLLGEDVGRRKHMEVQGEPRQPLATKNENRGTYDFYSKIETQ